MEKGQPKRPNWRLPLVGIAPAFVAVLGVLTAAAITLFGVIQLSRLNDRAIAERAELFASAVRSKLESTPEAERRRVLSHVARESGTELLLVGSDGSILQNEGYRSPSSTEVATFLEQGAGVFESSLGTSRFASARFQSGTEERVLLVFVRSETPNTKGATLGNAVLALTLVLLGIAVAVAIAITRAIRDDVNYVRARIVEMAHLGADPAGEAIAVRSLDQVGVLTTAFNALVRRFAEAERTYEKNLERAATTDRERSAFLSGLSHELRTPLNAVLGFAHVLESEVDGPLSPDAREYLGVVRTSGEHLRALIADILDLSALETGTLRLMRGPVDIHKLAEAVVREATATLQQKPLELSVTGERAVYAYGDRRRIRQIITNLVSNAVKFTSRGWVTVQIESRAAMIAISVSDTGPGIPKDDAALIFQEYAQAGDATARRSGTGLGLAITKRLVAMHEGTIEVQSEVGRGSRFTVSLPRCDAPPPSDILDPTSVSEEVSELKRLPPPPPSRTKP